MRDILAYPSYCLLTIAILKGVTIILNYKYLLLGLSIVTLAYLVPIPLILSLPLTMFGAQLIHVGCVTNTELLKVMYTLGLKKVKQGEISKRELKNKVIKEFKSLSLIEHIVYAYSKSTNRKRYTFTVAMLTVAINSHYIAIPTVINMSPYPMYEPEMTSRVPAWCLNADILNATLPHWYSYYSNITYTLLEGTHCNCGYCEAPIQETQEDKIILLSTGGTTYIITVDNTGFVQEVLTPIQGIVYERGKHSLDKIITKEE